jgi:two-component sensor histidine kinase
MRRNGDEYRPSIDPWFILREISHRVFNEFTAAICAVSAAAAESDNEEIKAVLGAVSDRLHSYARVQRALDIPSLDSVIDASAYLQQLFEAISRAKLSHCGIELVFVDHQIELETERCWLLGLIVSELITNAVRHGLKACGGTIRIELRQVQTFVECSVADNGASPTEMRTGRGIEIIQALARELEGQFDQQFGPQGSVSILTFPIGSPTINSSKYGSSLGRDCPACVVNRRRTTGD